MSIVSTIGQVTPCDKTWQNVTNGYGSIPSNTIFRGMNIHKSQLFWCELQGYYWFWHTAKSWLDWSVMDMQHNWMMHSNCESKPMVGAAGLLHGLGPNSLTEFCRYHGTILDDLFHIIQLSRNVKSKGFKPFLEFGCSSSCRQRPWCL